MTHSNGTQISFSTTQLWILELNSVQFAVWKMHSTNDFENPKMSFHCSQSEEN